MKKAIILILVLSFAAVSRTGELQPTVPEPRGVKAESMGFKNTHYVDNDCNLQTEYDWLKSSPDLDLLWGALSVTNRRTFIITPGVYTRTYPFIADANFVDIIGLTGNPSDVLITCSTSGVDCVRQTCNDMVWQAISIRHTVNLDGCNAFVQAATDNSPSLYRFMNYYQANPTDNKAPVWGEEDIKGTWEHCNSEKGYSWRCADNKALDAYMYRCVSWNEMYNLSAGYANGSFGGDQTGVEITGALVECKAGDYSFGGCSNVGCDISGTLTRCEAGDSSYAMGKDFSGYAFGCKGGLNCFGGYAGSGEYYGTFSGYAIESSSEGGNSFGMGHASCTLSGTLIRCRYGTEGQHAAGQSLARVSTVVDEGVQASLTTALDDPNNDLLYMAKEYGSGGNDIQITYWARPSGIGGIVVTGKSIVIKTSNAGTTTAAEVEGWVEADSDCMEILSSVENAPDNDGTGTIPSTGMSAQSLSGGTIPISFSGNHPLRPISCDANFIVYPFDNGATYNNYGADSNITGKLPEAIIVGLEYTFTDIVADPGVDFLIDPNNTNDYIRLSDGTVLDGGEMYMHQADAYGEIKLKVEDVNYWTEKRKIGTFVEESP